MRHIGGIEYQRNRIRSKAGLSELRIHDLRHSQAPVVAMYGVEMVTIANLLGDALVETTARYAHLAEAALSVGTTIAEAMAGAGSAKAQCASRCVPRGRTGAWNLTCCATPATVLNSAAL